MNFPIHPHIKISVATHFLNPHFRRMRILGDFLFDFQDKPAKFDKKWTKFLEDFKITLVN